MSTYFAEYIGYIDERKRPENFPHEIRIQDIYENIESTEQLQSLVNEKFVRAASTAGWVVLKEPAEIIDSVVILFNKCRFVPWHMLTHMELKVRLIPSPAVLTQDVIVPSNTTPDSNTKALVN